MSVAQFPARCPDVTVLRGNGWSQQITLPAADTDDNPITWGTVTVTSEQTDQITVQQSGSGTVDVVLSLTAAQVDAITGNYMHWYVSEDTAMAGNEFLTGRVKLVQSQ